MIDDASLPKLLAEAEALLQARTRARMGRDDGALETRELSALLDELESAAAARPEEASRHARRLAQVRALAALQLREVPDAALAGLYEDIHSSVTGSSAWHRAGMSGAFLDAPRSLVLWRRAALAACLLLAVGTGFSLGGGTLGNPGVRYEGQTMRLVDPRDERLERLDARAPAVEPAAARPRPARSGLRAVGAGNGQAPRGGVFVFGRAPGRASVGGAEARRMLDGIQIFPVPGRTAEEGEQN